MRLNPPRLSGRERAAAPSLTASRGGNGAPAPDRGAFPPEAPTPTVQGPSPAQSLQAPQGRGPRGGEGAQRRDFPFTPDGVKDEAEVTRQVAERPQPARIFLLHICGIVK